MHDVPVYEECTEFLLTSIEVSSPQSGIMG